MSISWLNSLEQNHSLNYIRGTVTGVYAAGALLLKRCLQYPSTLFQSVRDQPPVQPLPQLDPKPPF